MGKETQQKDILKNGYVLNDYRIISVLGRGAFGITYKAYDEKNSETVAIKEFFYSNFVVRENNSTVIPISSAKGKQKEYEEFLQKFQDEAETISKLNHINIVKVSTFFRANNTAYFVMSYDEGETLGHRFENNEKFENEEDILEIIIPVLEGLKVVHQEGFLHRDLKPDNIYLRDGGLPMLLDFGAARFAIGKETKSLTAIATPGYAPPEQYSEHSKQSASTDLYAVGAILYKMITGVKPPDANHRQTERLNDNSDPIEKLSLTYKSVYSKDFLKAVDASLELKPKERPQNIEEFQETLLANYNKGLNLDPLLEEPLVEEDIFGLIKKYWYIWTILGLLIFIMVFLSMKNSAEPIKNSNSMKPSSEIILQEPPHKLEPVAKLKKNKYVPTIVHYYALEINPIPSDAQVQIMNIKDKYFDGIELSNGTYNIKVSKDGYEDRDLIIYIDDDSKRKTVKLKKIINPKKPIKIKKPKVAKAITIPKVNSPVLTSSSQEFAAKKRQQERCRVVERKMARLNAEIERIKSKNRRINNKLAIELAQKKRVMDNAVGTYAYKETEDSYRDFVLYKNNIVSRNGSYVNQKVREFKIENNKYNRMTCVR